MESLKRVKLKDLYVLFIFIYFISLPLGAISLGSFGSALRLLAVVPIALAFFAKRFTLTPPLAFHALFVFISLAATLWSVNIETSFSRITSYFLLLMLLVSGCCFELDEKDIAKIKAALEWSSILTAALMMLFAKTVNGRLRLNDIIVEDPNYICAYLFFGIVVATQRIARKSPAKIKVISVLELAVLFYVILMTGSRGGLIAAVIAVSAMLIFDGEFTLKGFFAKIFIIGAVIGIFILIFSVLPEDIRLRFTMENVEERGASGRFELWENAVSIFNDSDVFRKLFGFGPETLTECYGIFGFTFQSVAHNVFIDHLVEIGVVGLISYTIAIVSFAISAFKKADRFAFAVILGMIALSMSTSISTFKPYYNIMLFILIVESTRKMRETQTKIKRGSL